MDDILRISDSEIKQVLSISDFLSSCHEAFRLYGTGIIQNPPRNEEIHREGNMDLFFLEMPGEWPGRYRVRKVIRERSNVETGLLGDRTAVIKLKDVRTGRCAVLDAEYITNMRTGAAGALGARYLGQERIQKIGILGTGRVSQALALCADQELRPVEIRVMSRNETNRDRFAKVIGPSLGCRLVVTESIQKCLDGVCAVLTAVPTPRPVLVTGDMPENAHISVMGGDSRTVQLETELLRSRLVVVDHLHQARKSGEFQAVLENGHYGKILFARDREGRIQTIGDAALGRLEHQRNQGSVAYFTGMAVQDLHIAAVAYERILNLG